MKTDNKPRKKKWFIGLLAVIASLLMCFTFSSNSHVYADNSKQTSSSAASSSSGSSGSSNASSGTASEQQADPWTQAVYDLSGKYSTKKGDPWPTGFKGHVNLGNIYSYLGPQNPVFAQNSTNGYADNFSSDGNHQENAHGMANMALGFGSAMYTVGLDHPLSNNAVGKTRVNLGRILGGTCYLLAYTAVVTINKCFSTLTGWIKYVNVLDWLGNFPTNGPFGDLGETVKGVVQSLQGLGIVFWSFALAVLLLLGAMGFRFAGGNLSGNTHVDAGPAFIFDEILHFAFRLFNFLVLPLLLATVMDEILSDAGSTFQHDAMEATTTPIYSTLVDFKGAVQHSRLDLPSSIKLAVSFNPNAQTSLNQSQVCDFNAYSAGDSAARDAQSTSNNYNDLSSGSGDIDACYHLISEWMHAYEYEPADFVSYAEGHTGDNILAAGTSKSSASSSDSSNSSQSNGATDGADMTMPNAAPTMGNTDNNQAGSAEKSSESQASLQDDLEYAKDGSDHNAPSLYVVNGTLSGKWGGTYSTAAPAKDSSCMKAGSSAGGLSTLGMYNYLATDFDDSSASYETNAKNQTTYDGVSHYEVGIAGRGLAAFANWMLSLSQLVCIAIFGVWTFIAVISAVFSGMVKALMYLGANALGALQGTVKLVACCVMLIIEFVGTSFFYIIGIHLLLGASQLLPEIVNSNNQGSSFIVQASSNVNFTTGANLLTSIALFWLTFQMIRLRGVIMKSFNEMAESAVRSVLGSPDRHFNHSANLATNEAANGHTYNARGENDLKKVERDSNSGLNGGNGAPGRNGRDGHGSIVGRGQFQQSPKNANPTGFGRFANYKQGKKDAINAKEQQLNRHLTDAERKQVEKEYARQQAGNAAFRVAGRAMDAIGSHKLAQALTNHAANRDAKQQVQRMEAAMDGKKLRESGAFAKDQNTLDQFAAGKRTNGQIDKDAAETKAVEAREQAMQNVDNAMQGMSDQVGDALEQQKAEDGTLANQDDMMKATENAMQNSMSDTFNDIAKNGGSLQQMAEDVNNKNQALQDAKAKQQDLSKQKNEGKLTEEQYQEKLADSSAKIQKAEKDLKKAQTSARVAAGATAVSASMLKKPNAKKAQALQTQQKKADAMRQNGNIKGANGLQANINKSRNQMAVPTVAQANKALQNVAKARNSLNQFVQRTNGTDNKGSGISFAKYTPDQQKELNEKVAAVKAAERHADQIGLAKETYDTTEHLMTHARDLNRQLNAGVSAGMHPDKEGNVSVKDAYNTSFAKGELTQNVASQIAQSQQSTLTQGGTRYDAVNKYQDFKDSANSFNNKVTTKIDSLKRK